MQVWARARTSPRPTMRSSTCSATSESIACRTVIRATPKRSVRSRSEGIGWPGHSSPPPRSAPWCRGPAAGSVDVRVYGRGRGGVLRRAYRYVEDMRVTDVAPLTGPLEGGTRSCSPARASRGPRPSSSVGPRAPSRWRAPLESPPPRLRARARSGGRERRHPARRLAGRHGFTYADGTAPSRCRASSRTWARGRTGP